MKTYFYTLVLTLLTSTLLLAQNGTQKNYQDSVNYIEVPIVNPTPEERAQQIQDSIRIANLQANIRDYQKEQIKNNGNASRAVNNDTCGDAIGLTMEDVMCSTPIMGTNVDATASNTDNPAPPMNDQTNDVWYQIIVPNSGIFGMDFTIGTEGDFQLRYAFYTGNCTDLTEVWNRHIGGYNTYNEVFNFAPAGTVLYLRVDPTNKDNNPDAFSICFYQRSCKEANLGWTDVLSCDNTNDFYVNFQIYNFGSGDQLTFKSDGVADVTVMAADNNYGDLYPVGPFPMGQEVTIDIEPDDAICNQSYSFFRSANTTISNAVPCSAIDISSAIGSTYDYTEGTDYNIEYVCTPMVPRGGCNAIGYWQDNNNFDGSEWFSFVASASENLKFTFSSNESHYSFKVAIWDAVSCTDIQNGTPELVTAYHPCNSSEPFSITASCLDIGKTYYLQVADSYVNYSIAVEEVSLPCTILNDKSEDAISLTVQTDPCGTTETAFNVGATDSRNDTNVPNFIDNFTEYDNDSNPIGDGTDIWFKTIVPASGNLSIKVTSVNDDNFKAVANLYTGTVNLLEHLNTGAIYWQGEVGIIYFSGLPVGEEIHIAIDYRNNGNQTGYFDLCVMDPSCLPMDWHTGRIVINCENTNEYFVDVVIVDVATATTFNIVNVNDNTIYYEDLSAIGTYTIGPIPISNASIEVKVVSDNPSCDREGNYMYTEANTISNYLPCSAIDLSSAIGGSYDYAEGSISNNDLSCTPAVPTLGCDQSGAWQHNDNHEGNEWFSFEAPASRSLTFTFSNTINHSFRAAIWEATTCTDILGGTPTLVTALEPCNNNGSFSLTAACLDLGKTYYLQVSNSYENYSIAIEEVTLPCTLLNDKSEDAIALTVQSDPCSTSETTFNIGATDSRFDTNTSSDLQNFGDDTTIGADVWFKTTVPASGNLAVQLTAINDGNFRAVVNVLKGAVANLEYVDVDYIDWEGEEGTAYFSDLPIGAEIHLAIDYRNNQNAGGYFDICLVDPNCIPMEWTTGNRIIYCDDSNEYFVGVFIIDKGTASTFSIVNAMDNTVYHGDVTDAIWYTVGPLDVFDESINLKIVSDNPDCDDPYGYQVSLSQNRAPNDNMCDAISLNAHINAPAVTYIPNYEFSTIEDCEPTPPNTNCEEEGGWFHSGNNSTWTYFNVVSDNMTLTYAQVDWGKIAIWKAASCAALKDGTAVFVKGIEFCNSGQQVAYNLDDLEKGQRYYVQVDAYAAYTLELTSPTSPLYNACEEPDLMIANMASDYYYDAINTIESDATVVDGPVHFVAGKEITLLPGFEVSASEEFTAMIIACELSALQPEEPITEQQLKVAPKPNKQVSLQVSPNPLQQQANIRFYLPENTPVKIYVFDSNGQVLTEQSSAGQAGWQSTQLDASRLPTGMYFVSLQTVDGVWMERVVVAR